MESGSGHPTLQWVEIQLEQDLNYLLELIDESISQTPPENTRTLRKMNRWRNMLSGIRTSIQHIEEDLQPRLESELDVPLNRRGLLTISLFQPSTKNVFLEIQTHYSEEDSACDIQRLETLIGLSEIAKVLGLLGDAVIDIAILDHLWEPDVSRVGHLTQRRSQIVSNEHLSKICDDFGLYEHRIHFDPETQEKSEMEHIKGTLVEALFGVIYIERGFEVAKDLASILL
jgi:ribonuclease-3